MVPNVGVNIMAKHNSSSKNVAGSKGETLSELVAKRGETRVEPAAPALPDVNAITPELLATMGNDALQALLAKVAQVAAAQKKAADDVKRAEIVGRFAADIAAAELACKAADDKLAELVGKQNAELTAAGLIAEKAPAEKREKSNGTGTKRGHGVRDALAAWLGEVGPKTLAECQAHIWATHATYAEARALEATDKPAYYKGLNTCESSVKWYLTTEAPKGLGLKANAAGQFSVTPPVVAAPATPTTAAA